MFFYPLKEAAFRFFYFLLCFCSLFVLSVVFKDCVHYSCSPQTYFVSLSLGEVLWTYFRLYFYFACLWSFPLALIQCYLFFRPGLYQWEAQWLDSFIFPLALGFPLIGMVWLTWGLPSAWCLLSTYADRQSAIPLYLEVGFGAYLNFLELGLLCLGFGVLIIWALTFFIVQTLLHNRSFFYLGCLVFSVIVSEYFVLGIIVYEIIVVFGFLKQSYMISLLSSLFCLGEILKFIRCL